MANTYSCPPNDLNESGSTFERTGEQRGVLREGTATAREGVQVWSNVA